MNQPPSRQAHTDALLQAIATATQAYFEAQDARCDTVEVVAGDDQSVIVTSAVRCHRDQLEAVRALLDERTEQVQATITRDRRTGPPTHTQRMNEHDNTDP